MGSDCLGPKRCLNTQGFCGRWSFQDECRLWLLLNDPIKKIYNITFVNLLPLQLGACVADVKGFFHRSLLILLSQMTQKLRRHTSEPEREGAGH